MKRLLPWSQIICGMVFTSYAIVDNSPVHGLLAAYAFNTAFDWRHKHYQETVVRIQHELIAHLVKENHDMRTEDIRRAQ